VEELGTPAASTCPRPNPRAQQPENDHTKPDGGSRLSVSHYNLDTALALFQNSPIATFIFDNMVLIAPVLSFAAGVALLAYQQRRYPLRVKNLRTWLAAIATYLASLLFSYPAVMQSVGVENLILVLAIPPLLTSLMLAVGPRKLISLPIVLSVVTYLLLAYRPQIWLPPENLNVNGKVETLYVLQPQDSDLVVFDPAHDTVIRISKALVKSRVYCNSGPEGQLSEILLTQPTDQPMCANYAG
jgi:hypothetical protein